jgi:hypothetical protein
VPSYELAKSRDWFIYNLLINKDINKKSRKRQTIKSGKQPPLFAALLVWVLLA